MNNKLKKSIVIFGPTATGKSKFSVMLAEKINAEIISFDSMQVYKGSDIASAKPEKALLDKIPHHLISTCEDDNAYTVGLFKKDADRIIREIQEKSKRVILTGGTGLYIDSLIYDIDFSEKTVDKKLRADLMNMIEKDRQSVYDYLSKIDEEACNNIKIRDTQRIIRAIEYYITTGKKISSQSLKNNSNESEFILIGLNYKNRDKLYENIEKRVDLMMNNGLLKEAESAYKKNKGKDFKSAAAQMIGHKEFYPYFEGHQDLEESVALLKQKTRNYAKRQITWFKKYKTANWIYLDDKNEDEILSEILEVVKREDES